MTTAKLTAAIGALLLGLTAPAQAYHIDPAHHTRSSAPSSSWASASMWTPPYVTKAWPATTTVQP